MKGTIAELEIKDGDRKRQLNVTIRDDYDDDYDDGVTLTSFETRLPECLDNCYDINISDADLEIDDDSLPDLLSVSSDDVPDLIPHDYNAKSAYYNHTILITEAICNYNLPITGNSKE